MSRALHWAFLLLTLPSIACSGTETGNPPLEPILDPFQLQIRNVSSPNPNDPHDPVIEGGPGTVSPGEGRIFAWNLETQDPESVANIREDGSFTIMLPAFPSQHIRLQAASDEYSRPTTLEIGTASSALHIVSSCLSSITHTVWIPRGGSSSAELQNDCGELRNVRAFIRSSGEDVPAPATGRFVHFEVSASNLGVSMRDLLIITAETSDGARVREAVTLVVDR